MIHLNEAVIVEGRYDKIRLQSVTDALIVDCGGFAVFRDKDRQAYIRRLAEERGIIVFTDADAAGFRIRARIAELGKTGRVLHAYPPALSGKEKRKAEPGREGLLGVEGIGCELLEEALRNALPAKQPSSAGEKGRQTDGGSDAECKSCPQGERRLYTTADLYSAGLAGRPDSAVLRRAFLEANGLPPRLSVSALLKYMNTAENPPKLK